MLEKSTLPWNNDVELCTYSNDNFKKNKKSYGYYKLKVMMFYFMNMLEHLVLKKKMSILILI